MIRSLTLVMLFAFGMVEAQPHNISRINSLSSPEQDICLALLPDSTMLISTYREGRPVCLQMALKDTSWVKIDSQLADQINALMPTRDFEPHFKFSDDFTHLILTLQQEGPATYYESTLVKGEWSLFTPIAIDPKLSIWHGLAISSDHSKLFGRSKEGELYQFDREGESWSKGTRLMLFDQVTPSKELVNDVLTVGTSGLMVQIEFESSKSEKKEFQKKYDLKKSTSKQSYFFARLQPNGKWTAPSVISDIHPLADNVVLSPFGDCMLFAIGDFGMMPVPKVVQDELASGKGDTGVKNLPNSLKKELEASGSAMASRDVPPAVATVELNVNKPRPADGKYYALLIGNADYREDELDLSKPALDVATLSKTLTARYQFDPADITTLINGDRNAIFKALQELRSKITRKDNVLIFYAGHGYWDEVVKQGYWWPVDAEQGNPANWLSNSDLREQISAINSAHTLLISDACFSGAIFKMRSAEELRTASFDTQQLYRLRSRRAMTSGTNQVVPDDSPFIKYLVQFLNDNPDKFLSSGELFTRMRKSVMNNGMTIPQEGVIMNTGDEGGDFIFIKR